MHWTHGISGSIISTASLPGGWTVRRLCPVVPMLMAAVLAAFLSTASAQDTRKDELRILVGFAPGGTIDAIARVVADKLKGIVGGTVLVENRPGAGGLVATRVLAASPPDGSVLLLAGVTNVAI